MERDISIALVASEPLQDFLSRETEGGAVSNLSVGGKMYAIGITRITPIQEKPRVVVGTIGYKNKLMLQPDPKNVRYSDNRIIRIYDDLVELANRHKPGTPLRTDLDALARRTRALIDSEETAHAER